MFTRDWLQNISYKKGALKTKKRGILKKPLIPEKYSTRGFWKNLLFSIKNVSENELFLAYFWDFDQKL